MDVRELGWEAVDCIHVALGFCEHVNEPSGSIKGGEFLYCPGDCQLLKKDSAARSLVR
jgi:hypothetical protein